MIPGASDYGGQSLEELIDDLTDWQDNIKEVLKIFTENIDELESNGYWEKVDYDFKSSCLFLKRDFISSLKDIEEILTGIDREIKDYHVRLANQRGIYAKENHRHHRKVWKASFREYDGSENFNKLEVLYTEGSDMTVNMIDLCNLSYRLQDFVGRTNNETSLTPSYITHFNAPVQGYMQNISSESSQQNNNNSSKDNEEIYQLKIILEELKQLINENKNEEFVEMRENILDLENEINKDQFKKNRIKSFGKSLIDDMQKFNTMNAFSINLNSTIEQFIKVIERLG